MEMPDSVGRLHISAIKPPLFRERAALLFNSFYLLSKKGLLEWEWLNQSLFYKLKDFAEELFCEYMDLKKMIPMDGALGVPH